jgi:hypothetical protein
MAVKMSFWVVSSFVIGFILSHGKKFGKRAWGYSINNWDRPKKQSPPHLKFVGAVVASLTSQYTDYSSQYQRFGLEYQPGCYRCYSVTHFSLAFFT